jgi:hypothetical protein
MKGLTSFLLCLLVVSGSAFTTKKPKRKNHPSPIFTATAPTTAEDVNKNVPVAAFVSFSVQDHIEIHEEPLVSPGTAAIACLLTIAIGFGLGYHT